MKDNILKIINQIKINKGEDKLYQINEKDTLRDDIGLDSFDLAELTVCIEVEYDIDIFEDGMVLTIEDIYNKLSN